MRSGTSFFDWTTFKKTVTRFWPLWGAYFAIWLLEMPLNGLMRIQPHELQGSGSLMGSFAIDQVPNMAANGGLVSAVVFGVLSAMAVFSHLYNARSANFFGALPVKREGLFLTHYLAGLSFFIVPNAVIFLLTLLVEAVGGFVCAPALLFWLAVCCGEGFLFYSMAVFCAMFTGHILALPVFYGILNGIVAGVMTLLEIVLQAFYHGFTSYPDGVHTAMKWLTPVVQLGEAVSYNSYADIEAGGRVVELFGWSTVGIYALAGLVLSGAAFFLYRARRLESAGDVVAVKAMRPVFRYGVALCAGLAFGMGTLFVIGGGEAVLMIAIVVWGVIGSFAAQMLLDKSFRVFHKWKGAAAVTAVFVVMFLVVGFDLTGFETRIPDPASVQSVNVSGVDAVHLQDEGDRLEVETADPEIIRLLSILHKEAVAQRDEERQTQAQRDGVSIYLSLDYTLQGGGRLSRSYSLWLKPSEVEQEGTAAWAVQQLYNNRELYWEAYGFAKLEECLDAGFRLETADHGKYDEDRGDYGYSQDRFYGQDAAALLAAVKEDFFAGRIGVRRVDDEDHWYYGNRMDDLSFYAELSTDGSYRHWSVEIALQDTASSTLAALEEMADRAATDDMEGYRW